MFQIYATIIFYRLTSSRVPIAILPFRHFIFLLTTGKPSNQDTTHLNPPHACRYSHLSPKDLFSINSLSHLDLPLSPSYHPKKTRPNLLPPSHKACQYTNLYIRVCTRSNHLAKEDLFTAFLRLSGMQTES